jgi:hypothetical protein
LCRHGERDERVIAAGLRRPQIGVAEVDELSHEVALVDE